MNVTEAIERVRERIHDREGRAFLEDELLRSFDDQLRRVFTKMRVHGDGIRRSKISLPTTDLQKVENGVYWWRKPSYVADVQMVQLKNANQAAYQVPRVALEEQDIGRSILPLNRNVVWFPGNPGYLELHGTPTGFSTMEVWFIREIPPMLTGTVAAATSTTMSAAAVEGAYKPTPSAYVDSQIEFTSGPAAGRQALITAYDGTWTFEDLGATPVATNTWAMVLPLPPEYHEYFVCLVSYAMLIRQGASEELGPMRADMQRLEDEFERGISRQTSGEPPRFHSSRRMRR